MTTVERKEFQETKVLKSLSPVRNARSNQNLSQFDSNLDYLLEDLQNSVSRPGSSLGQSRSHTLESNRTNSLNRVTNIKSSNPVTEYSSDDAYTYSSPDGRKKVTGYKKESYSTYKSGGDLGPDKSRMQNSINQLDSLLDDLQQVKKTSYSESYKPVNRELHYGDTPKSMKSRTLERMEHSDYQYSSEGTYGALRPTSPSPSSRTSTLSKQTKIANVREYPLEVVETPVPDIDPEVLSHLDPELRPPGNTKVTTTIKTYTYEIPGSGDYPTNLNVDVDTRVDEKYIYSPNDSQTTPSRSFTYQKYDKSEERSENRVQNYRPQPNFKAREYYKETLADSKTYPPPYEKPAPPGGSTLVKETVTTRNYQPGYNHITNPPKTQQTYIYNESTTTKNINENGYTQPPPSHTTYITEVNKSTTNKSIPYSERNYPVYNPPADDYQGKNTYLYKETINKTTRNPNGYPAYPAENRTIIYEEETKTTNNYPGGPQDVDTFDPKHPPYGKKPEPVNIQYKYSSSSETTNNYRGGYPNDKNQNILPPKFPTDTIDSNPPKKLDELMATIGHEPPNSPLNAGYNAHEQDMMNQKKIDSLRQQKEPEPDDTQKKEIIQRTKNVSGPPVYYPPGQEMFASKEEYSGGGRYAKAKQKYEYESGMKQKSSSGKTVVPVCLPLCCGLPCTII